MGGIAAFFLDAVFPRYCLSCSTEGKLVCATCERDFSDLLYERRGDHFASFAYGNPLIRDLIKHWKYDFDQSAFEDLKRLASPTMPALREFLEREGVEVITCIPLSKRRMAERGFNQAEMIARFISEESGITVEHLLDRKESVGHQAERTDEERQEAMKESPFIARISPSSSPPRSGGVWGGQG
jgi:competence protein ComFC